MIELNDIQPNPSFQINLPDTFYSKITLGIKHQSNGNPALSHAMPDRPMLNFILAHLGMARIASIHGWRTTATIPVMSSEVSISLTLTWVSNLDVLLVCEFIAVSCG